MANPYRTWVEGFVTALRVGEAIGRPEPPLGKRPSETAGPKALVFAPHPDDEVIIGGLPLRLMRERGFTVVNVAVTLGSKVDRQAERWRELQAACGFIGFGLTAPGRGGLEGINPEAREQDPARWAASVLAITAVLAAEKPHIVFLPHGADWNRTHIGVHHLVIEAMARLPALECQVVETEYWGAMATPNLMVESSPDDVADLVAALALHEGEVARNAYHLRLPAWLMDNVRRGAELVGGQGGTAPRFTFATLYRLRAWAEGRLHDVLDQGRAVAAGESLDGLFPAGGEADPWR
jgi:LmbE family N-acetylglucosaminyl deacetylase